MRAVVRKMRRFVASSWLAAQVMAMSAGTALAQTPAPKKSAGADLDDILLSPEKGTQFEKLPLLSFNDIVSNLIKLTLIVAALVFFFWLVFGGIRWMMSGGDKAKTEEARGQITAALIGLVIVFSAWAIAQLIKAFFGVDILQLKLKEITPPSS